MNTHTVRRHLEALAMHQQNTKMTDPFSRRTAQEFLSRVVVRLSALNPASAGREADDQPQGFA
jgi:hypothetical protein